MSVEDDLINRRQFGRRFVGIAGAAIAGVAAMSAISPAEPALADATYVTHDELDSYAKSGYTTTADHINSIDNFPGAGRLAASASAMATSITLRTAPDAAIGQHLYIWLGIGSPNAELVSIASVSGATVTLVTGLLNAHSADAPVVFTTDATLYIGYFGAAPQKTAVDNTLAVQAAINLAWRLGGVVQFGVGVYLLNSLRLPSGKYIPGTMTLDTNMPASQITLRGAGRNLQYEGTTGDSARAYGTVLRQFATGVDFIVQDDWVNGLHPTYYIEKLNIVGPDTQAGSLLTTTSGKGMVFKYARLFMSDVNFSLFGGDNSLDVNQSYYSEFRNLFFHLCKVGLKAYNAFNNNVLYNISADRCVEVGIWIDSATSITLCNPLVQSNNKTGLLISNSNSITVVTPYAEANNTSGTMNVGAIEIRGGYNGATVGCGAVQILNPSLMTETDSIRLSGTSSYVTNKCFIQGGYGGIKAPSNYSIYIENAYVVDTRIIEFAPVASINNSGSRTTMIWAGQEQLVLGSASAPTITFGPGTPGSPTGIYGDANYLYFMSLGANKLRLGGNGLYIGAHGPGVLDHVRTTITLAPGTVGANSYVDITPPAIPGLVMNRAVRITPVGMPASGEAMLIITAAITAADTLTVRVANPTASSITPASRTWVVESFV